jgi:hypothetical protein
MWWSGESKMAFENASFVNTSSRVWSQVASNSPMPPSNLPTVKLRTLGAASICEWGIFDASRDLVVRLQVPALEPTLKSDRNAAKVKSNRLLVVKNAKIFT